MLLVLRTAKLGGSSRVALQQIVETTVTGLGYDLVEIERSAGGLLRITIERRRRRVPSSS
jgi:ribosome maturation factor RimP